MEIDIYQTALFITGIVGIVTGIDLMMPRESDKHWHAYKLQKIQDKILGLGNIDNYLKREELARLLRQEHDLLVNIVFRERLAESV